MLRFRLRLPGKGCGSGEREAHPRRRPDLVFRRQLEAVLPPPRAGGSGVISLRWGDIGPSLVGGAGQRSDGDARCHRVSGGAPRSPGVRAFLRRETPRIVDCGGGGRWRAWPRQWLVLLARRGADGRSSRALSAAGGVGPGREPRFSPELQKRRRQCSPPLCAMPCPLLPFPPTCWGLQIDSCSQAAPYGWT